MTEHTVTLAGVTYSVAVLDGRGTRRCRKPEVIRTTALESAYDDSDSSKEVVGAHAEKLQGWSGSTGHYKASI